MQLIRSNLKCEECFRPVTRRLGLFQAQDDFECYAERYVKCFWGMCDYHKSMHSFITGPEQKVITTQPERTLGYKNNHPGKSSTHESRTY